MSFASTSKQRNPSLMSKESVENSTDGEEIGFVEYRKKSVENILNETQEAIGNLSLSNLNVLQTSSPIPVRRSSSSPTSSPRKNSKSSKQLAKSLQLQVQLQERLDAAAAAEDSISKSSDSSLHTSGDFSRNLPTSSADTTDKPKSGSRLSERAKKKAWYSVLYPSYKSRSEDFKKQFKNVPDDERLVIDYSCALQREILVHGRLYASQNYLCFHANIFGWETCLSIKWKDVTSVTKEKTARVIPNAILVCTEKDKYFFASFTSRDKAFLMIFRVWQNALMDKHMPPQEMWQFVHSTYGEELGLTSDDEDYIDPHSIREEELSEPNNSEGPAGKNSSAKQSSSDNCSGADSKKTSKKNLKIEMKLDELSNVPEGAGAAAGSAAGPSGVNANSNGAISKRKVVAKNSRHRDEATAKITAENMPTDMSDSSDSDANKIPFVSTAECTSTHEGRQIIHTILPINIDTLFTLLFSKSKFLLDFHATRKTTDMIFGDWAMNANGLQERTVNLTITLSPAVGPKTSRVTETQKMRECTKPGELYSIDVDSVNAGIPYADSFMVIVHYCLMRTVDDHTMLSAHAQIKYKKSIFSVVKGFIERNTWAGLEDFYTALLRALQSETNIPPAKGKGRRPRRGIAACTRPIEEHTPPAVLPETVKNSVLAPKQPCVSGQFAPAASRRNYRGFSYLVLLVLFSLIMFNVILFFKLWNLEERIQNDSLSQQLPNLPALKNLPNSHEEWVELLRQQEHLHEIELKKWQTVLQTAIELLKKTENTLGDLLLRQTCSAPESAGS